MTKIDTQAIRQKLHADGHDYTPGDGSLVDTLFAALDTLDVMNAEIARLHQQRPA